MIFKNATSWNKYLRKNFKARCLRCCLTFILIRDLLWKISENKWAETCKMNRMLPWDRIKMNVNDSVERFIRAFKIDESISLSWVVLIWNISLFWKIASCTVIKIWLRYSCEIQIARPVILFWQSKFCLNNAALYEGFVREK